jgi:hypothetical protein
LGGFGVGGGGIATSSIQKIPNAFTDNAIPKTRTAIVSAPFIVWQVGGDQRIYYLKGSVTEIREINKCQLVYSVIEN